MGDVHQPIAELDFASGPDFLPRTDAVANKRRLWIGPEAGWSGKQFPTGSSYYDYR